MSEHLSQNPGNRARMLPQEQCVFFHQFSDVVDCRYYNSVSFPSFWYYNLFHLQHNSCSLDLLPLVVLDSVLFPPAEFCGSSQSRNLKPAKFCNSSGSQAWFAHQALNFRCPQIRPLGQPSSEAWFCRNMTIPSIQKASTN